MIIQEQKKKISVRKFVFYHSLFALLMKMTIFLKKILRGYEVSKFLLLTLSRKYAVFIRSLNLNFLSEISSLAA